MKFNFEDANPEEESINANLDEEIEAEQQLLRTGVESLIVKTEKISASSEDIELSPEVMQEVVKEAEEIKERVYSMSERGFVTPEFLARLVPLAAFYGLVVRPNSLDTAILNTPQAVIWTSLIACMWAISSIVKNAIKGNNAHWMDSDKGWDFFEFDIEELKRRWSFKK